MASSSVAVVPLAGAARQSSVLLHSTLSPDLLPDWYTLPSQQAAPHWAAWRSFWGDTGSGTARLGQAAFEAQHFVVRLYPSLWSIIADPCTWSLINIRSCFWISECVAVSLRKEVQRWGWVTLQGVSSISQRWGMAITIYAHRDLTGLCLVNYFLYDIANALIFRVNINIIIHW